MSTISAEQQLMTFRSSMGPKLIYPAVSALAKINPARYEHLFRELHDTLTDEDGRFIMNLDEDQEATENANTAHIAEAIQEGIMESLQRFPGPGVGIDLVTFTGEMEATEPCENCGEIHDPLGHEEAVAMVRENPEDLLTALTILVTHDLAVADVMPLALGGPPSPTMIASVSSAFAVGVAYGAALGSDPIATGTLDPLDGLEDWLASLDKPTQDTSDEDEEEER